MKRLVVLLSFILIGQIGWAQQYYSKIFDFGGINGWDRFKAMIEKDDNLYLLVSYQFIDPLYGLSEGTKVVKMDLEGNILNERNFPWMVEQSNYGMNMLIEDDFLYLLNSYVLPSVQNKNPINLLQMDLQLDSIRMMEYDPIVVNPWAAADGSLTSYKEHFIATGKIRPEEIADPNIKSTLAFIMWINKSDLSLDTTYTFPTHVVEADSIKFDAMSFSFSNEEAGELYVFAEVVTKNPSEVFDRREIGFLIYKDRDDPSIGYLVDSLGTYLFDNTPFLTSEGLLLYEKEGENPVENEIVLMDNNGNVRWNNTSIPVNPYGSKKIASFMETSDGNIIGCGRVNWHFEYGQSDPDTISSYSAPYLIKLDIVTGEILWERFIIDYDENGEVVGNYFANVVEADNGDLICAGYRYNIDQEFGFFVSDSWIVRLDEYGCNPDFSCDDNLAFLSGTEDVVFDLEATLLEVYPNPVRDKVHIILPMNVNTGLLTIRNVEGQVCKFQKIIKQRNEFSLDLNSYPSGIYHVEYLPSNDKERRVYTAKVVVE